jgi:DNA repair exonuclease SbcCD ATPase subunit
MPEDLKQKLDLKQKAWKEKKKGHLHVFRYSIDRIKQQCARIEALVEEFSKLDNEEQELQKIKSIDVDVTDIGVYHAKKLNDMINEIEDELKEIKTIKEDIESEEEERTAFDINQLEREVISQIIRKTKMNSRLGSRF